MQGHELVASTEFKTLRAALDLAETKLEAALSAVKLAKHQQDVCAMAAITKEGKHGF